MFQIQHLRGLIKLRIPQICKSHNLTHFENVLKHSQYALQACKNLKQEKLFQLHQNDKKLIMLASLLHDADDEKFTAKQNNQNARWILQQIGLIESEIKIVIIMINLVSFKNNGDSIDHNLPFFYYYPRYADRLEAIGKIGIIRVIQYAKTIGNPIYTQRTIIPKNRDHLRQLIIGRDIEYKKTGKSKSVVDHFYDKLLHIKCPEIVSQNSYFRDQFERRVMIMEDFILDMATIGFDKIQKRMREMIENF